MKDLGDGNYGLYSGDVNQQGSVEIIDMDEIQSATQLNSIGYLPHDLNGDGIVESSDYSLIENNMLRTSVKP